MVYDLASASTLHLGARVPEMAPVTKRSSGEPANASVARFVAAAAGIWLSVRRGRAASMPA